MWRLIEPILRWFATRLQGMLSDAMHSKLNRKISLAGDYLGLTPEEFVALSALSSVVGLGVGWALGVVSQLGTMVCFAGGLAGLVFPHFRLSATGVERLTEINRRLPHAVDLLALSMGAGLDFPGAVRQVVDKSGNREQPLVEEFTLLLQSLQLGRTRRQALEEFAARAPSDAVIEFVGSVVQTELRGNPIVEVLRIQAEVSRRRRTVRAEELATRAGVAMIAPLALDFIAILTIIISPIVLKLQLSGG